MANMQCGRRDSKFLEALKIKKNINNYVIELHS